MSREPEPFPGQFPGTIAVPPDLPQLVEASDLVCLVRVVGLAEEGAAAYLVGDGEMEFNRVVAHAEVERVFNGAPAESVDVEFLRLDLPSSLARLDEGERAVLFLRRRDGRYGLVDPSTAKIPVDRVDEQTRRALLEARDGAAGEVARIATEILSAIAVTPG